MRFLTAMIFLFGSDRSPGCGWQVNDRTEAQALKQLFLYFAVDDPYGRMIRLHHITNDLKIIDTAEQVIDVTAALVEWGHLDGSTGR